MSAQHLVCSEAGENLASAFAFCRVEVKVQWLLGVRRFAKAPTRKQTDLHKYKCYNTNAKAKTQM